MSKGQTPRQFLMWALALVALITTASGIRGQQAAAAADAPQKGGTLTMSMKYNPTSIDPQKARTITDDVVLSLMGETLVKWENGKFFGLLARDWDVSPDGRTYTFHLRRGVKFHNGKSLTAGAVRASFKRISDPENPLPRAGNLTGVVRVEVVNDLTARVRLKAPDPDFLGKIMNIYIVEPGSWKGLGSDQSPAGTGPFTLASYIPDQRIVFKRFADYWGGEPYLDEVVVRVIPNVDTQVLELESGTIDFMDYALPKDVERLRKAGQQPLPFGRVNWARIAINLKTVSDVRLRKAICYAFDRNAVLQNAYYGLGTPQYTIALLGTPAYNQQVQPYRFNPDRARALLAEAGWVERQPGGIREKDGRPLVLDFPSRGDGEWLLSTQMIQQMLLSVGIDTRITTAAPAAYYSAVRTGKYDIAWWLSNAAPEPPIAASMLDSRQFWNVLQVPIPKVDQLLDQAGSTVDQKARTQYFRELQQVHHDMCLECLGHWTRQVFVAGSRVRGMTVDPTGVPLRPVRWWKAK